MFITSATIDDSDLLIDQVVPEDQLSGSAVEDLVRSLDGRRHTLLTLKGAGDNYMAIGGGADARLVVYATEDNLSFRMLLTTDPVAAGTIAIVAGGQPGDYNVKYAVTVDEAIAAAQAYASDGSLSTALEWELT